MKTRKTLLLIGHTCALQGGQESQQALEGNAQDTRLFKKGESENLVSPLLCCVVLGKLLYLSELVLSSIHSSMGAGDDGVLYGPKLGFCPFLLPLNKP